MEHEYEEFKMMKPSAINGSEAIRFREWEASEDWKSFCQGGIVRQYDNTPQKTKLTPHAVQVSCHDMVVL